MLLANFDRKEHLQHRAVSLRQHGFLVLLILIDSVPFIQLLQVRIFLEFRAMSYIWKATTAKQIRIDPYCQRQYCSPLNVLFIDVWISLILLGVPPVGGYNYITPRRAGLSATTGPSCSDHCHLTFPRYDTWCILIRLVRQCKRQTIDNISDHNAAPK